MFTSYQLNWTELDRRKSEQVMDNDSGRQSAEEDDVKDTGRGESELESLG